MDRRLIAVESARMPDMDRLVDYQEGYARIVVYRDGDDLVFVSDFDDNGRSIIDESRIPIADYVAKGEGRWPWFDLRDRRRGALLVFDALGIEPSAWTEPLGPDALELFVRARDGRASVGELLTAGADPDIVDACGATPLWYAVRSLYPEAALALIDAGADAGRRIELSARGERFTTILHEIVLLGRTVALDRVLARGVDPSLRDSDGATPMHAVEDKADHVYPEMMRALVAAGADVDATTTAGERPIEVAARRVLPATVAALIELGADPADALSALTGWWVVNARWAAYRATDVISLIGILRAAGADVTPAHRDAAATAAISSVSSALAD